MIKFVFVFETEKQHLSLMLLSIQYCNMLIITEVIIIGIQMYRLRKIFSNSTYFMFLLSCSLYSSTAKISCLISQAICLGSQSAVSSLTNMLLVAYYL